MLPDPRTLLLFMAAALALNVTPGPDMLYVADRSIGEGRLAGVVSALGIAAGTLFHIAALAFGLSALLTAVPLAYDVVRWAGAAYLIYLGIRALVRPVPLGEAATVKPAPLGAVFRQGLVTNVLNPKVALFSWPSFRSSSIRRGGARRRRPSSWVSSSIRRERWSTWP